MAIIDRGSAFTEAERRSDILVHLIGLSLAALAAPALIGIAVMRRGDLLSIAAVTIYAVCLFAMLGASAVYNIRTTSPRATIYRHLDHSAIYFKIAGSFTPLVVLSGVGGALLLFGLWLAAFVGTSLKIVAPDRMRRPGLALYLAMGWIGGLAGGDLLTALSPTAMRCVLLGGSIYTIGVVFFLWERLPFHTAIWHAFVLVATMLVYLAILIEVLREIDIPAL